MALDIVSYILGLQTLGGSGKGKILPFKSLTLEEDGNYTIVDRKDREHILEVEEESGQIVGITYDGEEIALGFDEDEVLTQIGEAIIDIGEYPSSVTPGPAWVIPTQHILSDIKISEG